VSTPARIIDCDVHCGAPAPDVLTPYLERHWADYLRDAEYRQPFGINYSYPAWSALLNPPGRGTTLDAIRGSVLDRAERAIIHSYCGLETQTHPYLARALASAVNRWLQAEWLDADDRLLATAVIAPQDTEGAVDEIRRISEDKRFVGVLLAGRAFEPYGSHRYWPIWEAAAAAGLALTITYGGSSGGPPTPNGWVQSLFEEYGSYHQIFAAHVVSLVASGVFVRWPTLRAVVMDSGWTWLPGVLWRMDTEWKSVRREIPWVAEPPSEVARRHVRLTTQPIDADVAGLASALELLGSDELLVFGSDYPRESGLPVDALLPHLEPQQIERLLWRNAWETFGLETRARTSSATAMETSG
jgi:predicted TIM-barrel fold metal-dependent hydrolase